MGELYIKMWNDCSMNISIAFVFNKVDTRSFAMYSILRILKRNRNATFSMENTWAIV